MQLTIASVRVLEQPSRLEQMHPRGTNTWNNIRTRSGQRFRRLGLWNSPVFHRVGSPNEHQDEDIGRWHSCVCRHVSQPHFPTLKPRKITPSQRKHCDCRQDAIH